jgi:cytochrome P450
MNRPNGEQIRFSLKALRADLLGTQKRLVKEHGGFVRYQVLRREFTLLADAEANQQVFISKLPTYGRSLQHDNLALLLGYGLICADGENWRRQRKLAQPTFDRALLARVAGITSMLMTDVLDQWERAGRRGEPVEVFSDMQGLAMRVIGMALFSHDLKTTSNDFAETVRVGTEVVFRRNISPVSLPLWFPTRLHRRLSHYMKAVDKFVYDRIDERLASNEGYDDILSRLLRSYGDQAAAKRRELRDQVVTLFFAGFETTGTALAWTWLLLGENPEAESRFHAELARVRCGQTPTLGELDSLTYTQQVIKESLRIYPPVYTMTRNAAADDQVGKHQICQGDNVIIPIHALHRMDDYWDEPEKFCPERFARARLTKEQRKAYIPFSVGQRKCLGANFATIEMLTVLATAGQRVRLRLVDGHPVVVAPAVTQYPRHGLLMRVGPRDQA